MKHLVIITILMIWVTGTTQAQKVTVKLKKYKAMEEKAKALDKFLAAYGVKARKGIEVKNAKLEELKALIAKGQKLEEANKNIAALTQTNREQKELLATKDAQLSARNATIEQLRKSGASAATKSKKIAQLQQDKKDLQAQIDRLKAQTKSNSGKDSQITELNKQIKNQQTKIEQQQKTVQKLQQERKDCDTKYDLLKNNLQAQFIPGVKKRINNLDFDPSQNNRLKKQCEWLKTVYPSQANALNGLIEDLNKHDQLAKTMKQYRAVLARPYSATRNEQALKLSLPEAFNDQQKKVVAAHQTALKNHCASTEDLYYGVKSARVHIRDNPQKTATKLREALKDLGTLPYTYLRAEMAKSLRNLNYVARITKPKQCK